MEEKKKEEVTEDKVFRALRKQLLATPHSAPLHYNLGLAYARREQLDESITCFQQAIVYDSKLVEAYINLGGIYLRKGNIEACIEANQKALEINPNHPLAHSNLGFALIQEGKLNIGAQQPETFRKIGIVRIVFKKQVGHVPVAVSAFPRLHASCRLPRPL